MIWLVEILDHGVHGHSANTFEGMLDEIVPWRMLVVDAGSALGASFLIPGDPVDRGEVHEVNSSSDCDGTGVRVSEPLQLANSDVSPCNISAAKVLGKPPLSEMNDRERRFAVRCWNKDRK